MKLTVMLILIACQIGGVGFTQQVTLHNKNALLTDIFNEIHQQTGYVFLYETTWLEKAKPVEINGTKIPLTDALDQCFKDQQLTYILTGKTIVLQFKATPAANYAPPVAMNVHGVVLNFNNEPIQGATVLVKGGNKITSTNSRGDFFINSIQTNSILVISCVGYSKEEINSGQQTDLRIHLKEATGTLDEVQFVGYGKTSKRLTTGNVTSVKSSDIENQPVQNPLLTLQGLVPGLFVTQTSGLSGASLKINIQGQNSLRNGSNPLYIVDGVPIDAQLAGTGIDNVLSSQGANFNGWGNPLNYLNPFDIESIEILKDAEIGRAHV